MGSGSKRRRTSYEFQLVSTSLSSSTSTLSVLSNTETCTYFTNQSVEDWCLIKFLKRSKPRNLDIRCIRWEDEYKVYQTSIEAHYNESEKRRLLFEFEQGDFTECLLLLAY